MLTFLALIAIRVGLVAYTGLLLVPRVVDCPACFRATTPVRHRWLERLARLEWRWCTHCGWKGVARLGRRA